MSVILLIGSNGQLGQELARSLSSVGTVISTTRNELDLTQPDQITARIEAVKPQIICNAAAYTAVDRAETEPELADAINAIAPKVMAASADQIGATLIHVSTDYVFDGTQSTPYQEGDRENPLNVYGRSKLEGEAWIRQLCDRHFILRTAWVYGAQGKSNFVKTMLRLGTEREELRIVADQVGTPTSVHSIAQVITQAAHHSLFGTYHFTNSGVASWYDFAIAIFEEAQQLGFPLQVNRVIPIDTSDYPTPAQRPAYSVLSSYKLNQAIDLVPVHWRQELRQRLPEFQTIHPGESR
ncbi:dTDP-4-dehydrorhamnose reductase [Leptolyngbya sp. NIES-3755]|nr:dTDP-4-dehydrorhamnose reductase [Leptolyngbya sp. NIES-3755]